MRPDPPPCPGYRILLPLGKHVAPWAPSDCLASLSRPRLPLWWDRPGALVDSARSRCVLHAAATARTHVPRPSCRRRHESAEKRRASTARDVSPCSWSSLLCLHAHVRRARHHPCCSGCQLSPSPCCTSRSLVARSSGVLCAHGVQSFGDFIFGGCYFWPWLCCYYQWPRMWSCGLL